MPEAGALYRCVCGTDVPLAGGDSVSCPKCGRRQRVDEGRSHVAVDTVVLARSGRGAPPDTPTVASGSAQSHRPNLAGRVLDHFELIEELGRGGMGTVYRALDRSLERYVALKVLDSEEARNQQDLVEAFVHEARTQARMNHPGIATIYYIGKFEEMTYFAMEIVSGSNLESKVRSGPLPFRDVIDSGLQVVRALKEAQERGVIHRDIKPGNIILSGSGRVKVTDFGLSKTEKGGLQITGTRQITGTPFYIAPEQAKGETTDFRTDIYSLGATLYHLAYGKPPFEGDNFMAVIAKHLSEPVRFPSNSPRDVPPGFRYVLERMLSKNPKDRFQSYEELEETLFNLRPEALTVAAFGRRAAASVLDHLLIFLFGLATAMLIGLVSGERVRTSPLAAFAMGAPALVYIVIQALRGQTLGKDFGKLRIARIDGRPLRRSTLLFRGVLQYLTPTWFCLEAILDAAGLSLAWASFPLILIVLGFTLVDALWAFTNANRRTLHDLIFKTWVLDKE